MLEHKVYSFSELRSILTESDEFKPRFGNGYSAATEKRNNEKAVKDITNQTKGKNVGSQSSAKTDEDEIGGDENKTTLDYNYAYEPSDGYKKRVKSLAEYGTTSDEEKKDLDDESVKGNKDFYAKRKKARERNADAEQEEKHAGLKSHNLPKENFKDKTLYTESKKMKRLHFKNTTFLNEEQMLKRIPDDYKVDGSKFIMRDSKNNEYLVECKKDALCEAYIHVNVLDHRCGKETVSEALNKFNHLCGYKSSDYNVKTDQLSESRNFDKILNISRKLEAQSKGKK